MKNIVHNYSEAEIKVREATSNDPWGPSSSLMSEIADLTYNVVAFSEIMSMIWKRLNDHGKNWRHVYKVGGQAQAGWCHLDCHHSSVLAFQRCLCLSVRFFLFNGGHTCNVLGF